MKLAYFDDFRVGVVTDGRIVDVTGLLTDIPHRDAKDLMAGLIERFDVYRPKLEQASKGQGVPLSSVKLRAPLPRPRQIDCMAVNYMEDGTLDEPAPINAFHKCPSAVIGPEETMILPDIPASVFEGEAEIAAVIGKRARNAKASDAMSYIFGYINFIDGSARGLPPEGNTFYQAKSRETFAPIGPWIVTADEISDPQKLQVRLWVNGKVKQDYNTDDMAHKIPRCIEWVSSIHTLEPGDILALGTNHRGLNAFHDGDVVEIETEGLGRLRFNVKDDLKRTWSRDTRLEGSQKLVAATGQKPPRTGVLAKQLSGKYAPAETAGV
jgi:2-keto-4-pentenoate hydratase/2-oxohepta-3-ene-1,7-dioic acid hydratase in catechol pathway